MIVLGSYSSVTGNTDLEILQGYYRWRRYLSSILPPQTSRGSDAVRRADQVYERSGQAQLRRLLGNSATWARAMTAGEAND